MPGTLMHWIKKNWFTALLTIFVVVMLVSPNAKSWFLEKLLSTGLFTADIKKESGPASEQATSFSFADSSGNITSTSSLKGKVVFINFWASWCPPCRAEMPSLNRFYNQLKDDGRFVFIFINEDEDRMKAIQYLQKEGFNIPLHFSTGNVPAAVFSGTLPTTVVLNKAGEIVLHHTGMANYNSEAFLKQMKNLL